MNPARRCSRGAGALALLLATLGVPALLSMPALLVVAAAGLAPAARADEPLVRLRAVAVDMSGGNAASRADTIEIAIERWTTDEEHQRLHDILVEREPEQLMAALQKIRPRVGFIRTSTSLGWDIQYAREKETPGGGRRIVFLTDRPMSFYERSTRPRSAEYEFIFAEIRVGPDGKGEGKLVPAAKVYYDSVARQVEIENYAIEPVRLTQVTVEKQTAER
jgi:hypothetical protein